MCDCISSAPISLAKFRRLPSNRFSRKFPPEEILASNSHFAGAKNGRSLLLCARTSRNQGGVFGSEDYGFRPELGFKEKGVDNLFEFETKKKKKQQQSGREREEDFVEVKESLELEDLIRAEEDGSDGGEGLVKESGNVGLKKRRQVLKRSSLLAKQVVSIRSALSLGFVSQLWVDTNSWVVLLVEVRPNLLSGEAERFLLEDVIRVGDVVLVEDETVIDHEFKMVGLETLVGYKVVTPGGRGIGKVRGYTFNINSGAVECLELDSFGISIIPSSLVSTYALLVEDVLEVVSDAIIVHETAASHVQRLTKGFLDNQNAGTSIDDLEEYISDFERPLRSGRNRRGSSRRKFRPRNRERDDDDWDFPMDYL